jgi:hypothetical protein
MTPKEKAYQIYDKIASVTDGLNKYPMCYDTAKQCSIILVWEIIDEINDNYDTMHSIDRKAYWNEVIREINKI